MPVARTASMACRFFALQKNRMLGAGTGRAFGNRHGQGRAAAGVHHDDFIGEQLLLHPQAAPP